MPLVQAVVLGILQGLTEFLPVSSSAHLALAPWALGWDEPGLAFDVASTDPHYHNVIPNNIIALHMFDSLVLPDREKGKLRPGLAESWKLLDDLTWEFKLRKGVKFHDGTEFTAEEAGAYNMLVTAWPEISRLAAAGPAAEAPEQLFS